jgi:16S rRNA C967 or C1407 C5-methylase (RsmB/RsmF family)
MAQQFGEGKAFEYCKALNEKAPLTIRVNPLKTTREEVTILLNN